MLTVFIEEEIREGATVGYERRQCYAQYHHHRPVDKLFTEEELWGCHSCMKMSLSALCTVLAFKTDGCTVYRGRTGRVPWVYENELVSSSHCASIEDRVMVELFIEEEPEISHRVVCWFCVYFCLSLVNLSTACCSFHFQLHMLVLLLFLNLQHQAVVHFGEPSVKDKEWEREKSKWRRRKRQCLCV